MEQNDKDTDGKRTEKGEWASIFDVSFLQMSLETFWDTEMEKRLLFRRTVAEIVKDEEWIERA